MGAEKDFRKNVAFELGRQPGQYFHNERAHGWWSEAVTGGIE